MNKLRDKQETKKNKYTPSKSLADTSGLNRRGSFTVFAYRPLPETRTQQSTWIQTHSEMNIL